jgi:hypothetical protein
VCLENENDKFQKSLSRPSIIDARAHYWATARRLRSIELKDLNYFVFNEDYPAIQMLCLFFTTDIHNYVILIGNRCGED